MTFVDLADIFGKPVGFLIGETDCDTYEPKILLTSWSQRRGCSVHRAYDEKKVSAEWLPEQSGGNGGDHEEWEKIP